MGTETVEATGLEFSNGLSDIIQAHNPPNLDDFMDLPGGGYSRQDEPAFSLYLLIVLKVNATPFVHVAAGESRGALSVGRLLVSCGLHGVITF